MWGCCALQAYSQHVLKYTRCNLPSIHAPTCPDLEPRPDPHLFTPSCSNMRSPATQHAFLRPRASRQFRRLQAAKEAAQAAKSSAAPFEWLLRLQNPGWFLFSGLGVFGRLEASTGPGLGKVGRGLPLVARGSRTWRKSRCCVQPGC